MTHRDTELAIDVQGTGPTLLLCIHGIGSSRKIFSEIFSAYKDDPSRTIVAVDLPGHGLSGPGSDYSLESHATSVRAVVNKFTDSCRQIELLCHSVGGAVGLLLSSGLPLPLKFFINVEGNLIAEDCGLITRRSTSVPFPNFKESLRAEIAGDICAQGEDPSDFLGTEARVFYDTAASAVAWSDSGKLLEMFLSLVPAAAYIYGERNRDMAILKRLGAVPTYEIPKSGHSMMVDNPSAFYRTVKEILGA